MLVGREGLEGEIRGGEENIGTADCEKFFFNYIDRCAVSVYFANLIVNRAAIEIANTY
jgi:hypothetical protein